MSSGRRYDRSRRGKLNMKKVFGVIIAIAVVIMIIISISKLLSQDTEKEQKASKEYYFAAYSKRKMGSNKPRRERSATSKLRRNGYSPR